MTDTNVLFVVIDSEICLIVPTALRDTVNDFMNTQKTGYFYDGKFCIFDNQSPIHSDVYCIDP